MTHADHTEDVVERDGRIITKTAALTADSLQAKDAEIARLSRRQRRNGVGLLGLALAIAIVFAYFAGSDIGLRTGQDQVRTQMADVTTQLADIHNDLKNVCRQVPAKALTADARDSCQRAEQPIRVPTVTADAPAPQISDQQLYATARSAVLDYCAAHNDCRGRDGSAPNVDDIATVVLAKIPTPKNGTNGADGQNVTDAQALSAVTAYCTAHDDCTRGPTDEQVAAALTDERVAAALGDYCTAHDQCTGPKGADGQPPAGWTYTDALGIRHDCVRADPFDPQAPRYTCP